MTPVTYDSITLEQPAGQFVPTVQQRANETREEAKRFLDAYRAQANHGPGLAYGHHHRSVAGTCRDADDETIGAIHIWPFTECHHEDWGYNEAGRHWCRRDPEYHDAECCKHESVLHKCYNLAVGLLKLQYVDIEDQRDCEDLAVSLLRIASGEPPKTATDCMFHAFALDWLGIMLATRDKWKNEHEAVELFKLCSEIYKYPGAFYHYGHALIHGTGGVKKDIPEGIAMLNQAGARRIAEAYFILGSVYETGISDALTPNIPKARDYYRAAAEVYTEQRKFEYDVAALKDWSPDFYELESMLPTESWHTLENETSSLLGERFNWCLVGQAFLFSAAASLTNVEEFYHFLPLLWLLPILGMLIAFFSIFHVVELTARYRRTRDPVHDMHNAKIGAYQAILDAAKKNHYQIDEAKLKKVKKHFEKYRKDVKRLRGFTSRLIHPAFIFMEVAFLMSWLVLVVYELSH